MSFSLPGSFFQIHNINGTSNLLIYKVSGTKHGRVYFRTRYHYRKESRGKIPINKPERGKWCDALIVFIKTQHVTQDRDFSLEISQVTGALNCTKTRAKRQKKDTQMLPTIGLHRERYSFTKIRTAESIVREDDFQNVLPT